jgi:hypothetical protein
MKFEKIRQINESKSEEKLMKFIKKYNYVKMPWGYIEPKSIEDKSQWLIDLISLHKDIRKKYNKKFEGRFIIPDEVYSFLSKNNGFMLSELKKDSKLKPFILELEKLDKEGEYIANDPRLLDKNVKTQATYYSKNPQYSTD